MLITVLLILLSFIVLIKSTDYFIDHCAILANQFKIDKIIVGILIIGLGTSLPEIFVSIFSALSSHQELALGGALGSNIANIGLVIGVCALFYKIDVNRDLLKKELLILGLVCLGFIFVIFDFYISFLEGIIMLIILIAIIIFLTLGAKSTELDEEIIEVISDDAKTKPLTILILIIAISLVFLMGSAHILVEQAITLAKLARISDAVIGATIIAIGTSLPELVAAFVAAKKKHSQLVVGNLIGSNIFNILSTGAILGIINPFSFIQELVYKDFAYMLITSLIIFLLLFFKPRWQISLYKGIILVLVYLGYLAIIGFSL